MNKVVGVYNSVSNAKKAKSAMEDQGYDRDSLKVIDQTGDNGTGGSHESVWQEIKEFFGASPDYDDQAHNTYTGHLRSGGALLAVTVPEAQASRTADLLYAQGAMDIQGDQSGTDINTSRAQYNDTRTADTSTAIGQQAIPVVQEDLVVGKREVNRGGVRVYSHVVSEPVSADVTLHDERVVVDRRPVDRAATDADFGRDATIEVNAMGEEAVVGKSQRVVEEVMVGKQASDRTEQINDTVRHTEVDVERTDGADVDTADRRNLKTSDRY